MTEQRSASYLAIYPKVRVPALATPDGILTETPAIHTCPEMLKPAAGLLPPPGSFAFARLQSFMAYLCSTVHPAHAHRMRGARWTDDPAVIEALKIKVPQNMADCFGLIEADGIYPARYCKSVSHRNRAFGRYC